LPIVATHDGGPIDIIRHCQNGVLINPLDIEAIGETLVRVLLDRTQWQQWSSNGISRVKRHYSWHNHVLTYLQQVAGIISNNQSSVPIAFGNRLVTTERVLICDIDNTLIGDAEALTELLDYLQRSNQRFSFGIATGRHLESALELLQEWNVPVPNVLITSVGSEIYYAPKRVKSSYDKAKIIRDKSWQKHINWHWRPNELRKALAKIAGLTLQAEVNQRAFKVSYCLTNEAPTERELVRYLRQQGFKVKVIYSHGEFVDILPIRASKGLAIGYLALKWGLPIEHFLVAGDSGNDEEMLTSNTLAIVVGNYSKELEKLRNYPNIYFAQHSYARGVLEGIRHYNFLPLTQLPVKSS
jgi:sucrose-phosphate synthase